MEGQCRGGRFRRSAALAISLTVVAFIARGWHDTMGEPVVRQLTVRVDKALDPRTPSRIVLLSDLHVSGPDMPPSRLARIVHQVNRLKPDLVVFAGDFVSDKRTATRRYSTRETVAPLAGLDPQAVKLAVPGNHDHWRDIKELERELARVRVGVLRNEVANSGAYWSPGSTTITPSRPMSLVSPGNWRRCAAAAWC